MDYTRSSAPLNRVTFQNIQKLHLFELTGKLNFLLRVLRIYPFKLRPEILLSELSIFAAMVHALLVEKLYLYLNKSSIIC